MRWAALLHEHRDSQASAAPAAIMVSNTDGHTRGSRSSTLVSSMTIRSPVEGSSTRCPTTTRTTLARPGGSLVPAPTPCRRHPHHRRPHLPRGQRRSQGNSRRSGELTHRASEDAPTTHRLEHCWRRNRQLAMCRVDGAGAKCDRTEGQGGDLQVVQRRAHPDDIGDGVPRPGLVERHLLDRRPMHRGLRLRQPLEHRGRVILHPVRKRRGCYRRANVGPGPMGTHISDRGNVNLQRPKPSTLDVPGVHLDAGHHRGDRGANAFQVGARVKQRAKKHVARHPGADVHPSMPWHRRVRHVPTVSTRARPDSRGGRCSTSGSYCCRHMEVLPLCPGSAALDRFTTRRGCRHRAATPASASGARSRRPGARRPRGPRCPSLGRWAGRRVRR